MKYFLIPEIFKTEIVERFRDSKLKSVTNDQRLYCALRRIIYKYNTLKAQHIEYFNTIFEEITKAANSLDFVLKIPRRTNHQTQRSNHNCSSNDSIEDYYSVSMYKPYLNNRFNENNETLFKLCWLIPNEMVKLKKN
ncbi:hypothetical protein ACI65C_006708 [Semiaphis heraclei]